MTEREHMSDHAAHENDAAPYALGALEPDEAAAFARHMESCKACRDEVAALAEAVEILPMSAAQHRAPRSLKRRVMTSIRSDQPAPAARARRALPRRRPIALPRPAMASVLTVALALLVFAGVRLATGGGGARVIRASVGDAELQVTGNHAELVIHHLPASTPGRIYELWLAHATGAPAPSTLFGVTAHGTADVGIPGSVRGVHRVLVTSEPAGGAPAPTTPPVIVARL